MDIRWIHLLLLGMLYSSSTAIDAEDVGNANNFVDETLNNLRKEPEVSRKLDPLYVPDVNEKKHKLRNIQIKGLLSLYRYGDCSLSYDGSTVNVVAQLAVRNVYVNLDYKAKAWFTWISGKGEIKINDLAVRLDFSSTNGNAKLNSFKVVHLGDYKVKKMTGLSFAFNWLLKIVANTIAQKSRGKIISALENEAGKSIGNLLKKVKLPI